MAKEYIEREAAITEFMQYTWYDEDGSTVDDWDVKRELISEMFSHLPAADVRENVKGEWIEDDDGDGRHCSICGKDYCYLISDCENYAYCPNCGAQMMGGAGDDMA